MRGESFNKKSFLSSLDQDSKNHFTGPKAPIVEGTKILNLYCFASSIMLCNPSILTRTARETFCSPMALKSAEKWMTQSMRCVTTAFWSPLKSNISAKMYGPASAICSFGLMISDRITFSRPYLARSNCAQAVPNCPSPPKKIESERYRRPKVAVKADFMKLNEFWQLDN